MASNSWRPRVLVTAGFATVAVLLTAGTAGAETAPHNATTINHKVAAKVRTEIAAKGKTRFWVNLSGAADLRAADRLPDKAERAAHVYRAETDHAARSQAGLRRLLSDRKADFTAYWIADTVAVTGDGALLDQIAARPEVANVEADQAVALPRPVRAPSLAPATGGAEWNIDRVNAPRVWHEFGVRGEGVTVANIDTGVDYDHPALAAKYRGRHGDGTVDHAYNWFDPAHGCPTAAPCDNAGHGTHTMGTMVGDDGGT